MQIARFFMRSWSDKHVAVVSCFRQAAEKYMSLLYNHEHEFTRKKVAQQLCYAKSIGQLAKKTEIYVIFGKVKETDWQKG